MSDVSRRAFMHAAGVAAMAMNAVPSASAAANSSRVAGKVKTISSANGLEATKVAYQMIVEGKDPADAVVAGVALAERRPPSDGRTGLAPGPRTGANAAVLVEFADHL